MGTTTTNRGYYKPVLKEKGWGTVFNASTDKVDVDMQANIDGIASVNADLQATKTDILLLSKMVSGEILDVAADRKTCTSANPFIAGQKAIFIGNARTFAFIETLPNTIILDNAVEDVDILIRMDYIKSS